MMFSPFAFFRRAATTVRRLERLLTALERHFPVDGYDRSELAIQPTGDGTFHLLGRPDIFPENQEHSLEFVVAMCSHSQHDYLRMLLEFKEKLLEDSDFDEIRAGSKEAIQVDRH